MAKTAHAVSKRRRALSLRFDTLVEAYQKDFETGRRNAKDPMERHRALQRTLHLYDVTHLRRFFGKRRLPEIDRQMTVEYGIDRQAAGAAISIVKGELWALDRLLRFAMQQGWLQQHPGIVFPREPLAPPPPATPRIQGTGLRPRRWFSGVPPATPRVPDDPPRTSKGAGVRRGYLKKPYGPDDAVPMDTLRKFVDDFKDEKAGKLTQRMNEAFPGLKASRKTIDTAVKKIKSSFR